MELSGAERVDELGELDELDELGSWRFWAREETGRAEGNGLIERFGQSGTTRRTGEPYDKTVDK